MFHKVHIEISNVCNLQCSFCPEVLREKRLISLELFESLVAQVAPLTEQVAFHLMGDPLVHPHLTELVEICARHRAPIFFVTNGVLMTDKKMDLLLDSAFRQVCFSLHSFHDNYPGRDPSEYLERIFQYTERALAERPELYINYRLWNLSDVRGSTAANQDLLDRIGQRFGQRASPSRDVRVRKSYRIKGRLYLHYDTEFTWPDIHAPIIGTRGTCYGLSSHFGIHADGTVVPCCLDKEAGIPLGNAAVTPLTEILAGPRAQAMLAGFQKNQLVEALCQRCQYIERFTRRESKSQSSQAREAVHGEL